MTGDLYPTKTRLALLDDVDAGGVCDYAGETWDTRSGIPIRVSARTFELERAGWVERPDGSLWWRLTPAGLAIRESGRRPA